MLFVLSRAVSARKERFAAGFTDATVCKRFQRHKVASSQGHYGVVNNLCCEYGAAIGVTVGGRIAVAIWAALGE
jgi:hypothetical protein